MALEIGLDLFKLFSTGYLKWLDYNELLYLWTYLFVCRTGDGSSKFDVSLTFRANSIEKSPRQTIISIMNQNILVSLIM